MKQAAACLVLLPLRVVLVAITMLLIWLLYRLSSCCGPSSKSAEGLLPHSRAERLLLRVVSPLWRLVLLWVGVLWIRVRRPVGERDAPNATIVANHVSTLDGPLLGYVHSCLITAVAMRWVCKGPYTSAVARAHHVLAVGRPKLARDAASSKVSPETTPAKSATDTIAEYQRSCAADSGLLPMAIFPEGTTKASRCLMRFRTGAFVSGEPVRPVCLFYPDRFAWIDSLPVHIFTVLTMWCSCVEVVVLPLYEPSPAEKKDPHLYARNVQAVMAKALDLPPEHCSMSVGAKELAEAESPK